MGMGMGMGRDTNHGGIEEEASKESAGAGAGGGLGLGQTFEGRLKYQDSDSTQSLPYHPFPLPSPTSLTETSSTLVGSSVPDLLLRVDEPGMSVQVGSGTASMPRLGATGLPTQDVDVPPERDAPARVRENQEHEPNTLTPTHYDPTENTTLPEPDATLHSQRQLQSIQPPTTTPTVSLPPHPLTAFNLSQRTGSHYWAWLEARGNERRLERFGKAMGGSRGWEGEDDGMGCEYFSRLRSLSWRSADEFSPVLGMMLWFDVDVAFVCVALLPPPLRSFTHTSLAHDRSPTQLPHHRRRWRNRIHEHETRRSVPGAEVRRAG